MIFLLVTPPGIILEYGVAAGCFGEPRAAWGCNLDADVILHARTVLVADVSPSLVGYHTAWALSQLGKKDEASANISQLLRDNPQDSGGLFTSVQAVLSASAGNVRGTEAKIRLAVEKGRGFGHFHHTAYHIATAFAFLNRPEQSIHWLETTAEDGFPCYPLFESDRNLDPLRKDARFVELLAKLQKQWIAYKALF